MTKACDILVIGSGPGGYVAAIRAAQLGFKVVCVDRRPTLGGTCLNVGCIPSKTLLASSKKYGELRHLEEWGIKVKDVEFNLAKMQDRKDKVVQELVQGIQYLFKKNNIEFIQGHAKFLSKAEILISKPDGKTETITPKYTIIATGSVPAEVPSVPIDEESILSSTGALALKQVPEHMVVIGGGYIGVEMASIWARLGAVVTVVEYAPRLVPTMDEEAASVLHKELTDQGIKFMLGHKVIKVEKEKKIHTLHLEEVINQAATTLKADNILVAVGRRPFTEGLGLEEIGVELNEKGFIKVEAGYQTTVPGVYAIGDTIMGPMLAHKAEDEGVILVEQLAGHKAVLNYEAIPAVVYTMPEVAAVGATEEMLKSLGVSYKVGKFPLKANSRAKSIGVEKGFVKILADTATHRILGAHIVAPEAGAMIAELALAMEYKASAEDIALTCHAHPTYSEAIKEAALAVSSKPIHI